MKKLYTILAAAAVCLTAQARELTWYNGNEPLVSGSEFVFNDFTPEIKGNVKIVEIKPDLYLGTDQYSSKIKVTAKANESIQLCCGSDCMTGTDVVKDGVKISSNDKVPLELHYTARLGKDEEVPRIVCELEAQDGNYADTLIKLTVIMNGESNGLIGIVSDNKLYSTAEGIHYNLPAATQLSLYGITGMKVLQTTVSGSGVISTSGIPAGIYVYTLGNKSGKILVR